MLRGQGSYRLCTLEGTASLPPAFTTKLVRKLLVLSVTNLNIVLQSDPNL